jgi:glutamine amidotransferase
MIIVIDYGMGNLRSVSKALEHLGAQVKVSAFPSDIQKAEKLVLPGVGAFGDAMKELESRGLVEPIRSHIKEGKRFLGICLGLQLLFDTSEENPGSVGLGLFPGKVQLFKSKNVKIPHMGWNQVNLVSEHPLLQGVPDQSYFYFVHSYYASSQDNRIVAGACTYGQETFAAMLGTENLFATQFHPEKSQEAGLQILKNFVDWK